MPKGLLCGNHHIYTVWLFIVAMEAMALIEIDDKHDDLPINMVMFHSYVKEAKGI